MSIEWMNFVGDEGADHLPCTVRASEIAAFSIIVSQSRAQPFHYIFRIDLKSGAQIDLPCTREGAANRHDAVLKAMEQSE